MPAKTQIDELMETMAAMGMPASREDAIKAAEAFEGLIMGIAATNRIGELERQIARLRQEVADAHADCVRYRDEIARMKG